MPAGSSSAHVAVGRLAVNVDGRARIYPINFVVDGQTIVFRTAHGTKLSTARGADVEFEVDHYDGSTGRAWSVIVAGRATEVTRADEWEHVHDLLLFPWQLVAEAVLRCGIDPEAVTGRRFRAVYARCGRRRHGSRDRRDRKRDN